jgi:uncharacterized protein YwqG
VYERLNPENIRIITNTDSERYGEYYCEIEFEPTLSIPDDQDIDDYDDYSETLIHRLWEKDHYAYQKLLKELGITEDTCQLGGYPAWIQSGINLKENFEFLFQIDGETNAGLRWCDCGMVYAFYNSVKKETEFKLECC